MHQQDTSVRSMQTHNKGLRNNRIFNSSLSHRDYIDLGDAGDGRYLIYSKHHQGLG